MGTGAPLPRQSRRLTLSGGAVGGVKPGDTVTIEADRITAIVATGKRQYRAEGHVEINTPSLRFSADEMTYDVASGEATASGHVAFDSVEEQVHIEGQKGRYNLLSSTGEFDDFQGVSGIRMRGREATETSSNPLIFSGRRLLRLGANHYRVEAGMVTSCTLPHPKWTLSAREVDVELGGNATLRHAVFRLFDVPIFFAPFLTHSTTRTGRHSGVLVPVASHSNIKGYILGDSFYWPAAPNLSVTTGAELYTTRGWADHLQIESLPTRNSSFNVQLDGVLDRGVLTPAGARLRQGGQELHVTGDHESASGFRSVLDLDYLSSYLYRLVFKNSFAEAINSEAISTGFSERQRDGQDLTIEFHRYQDFLGPSPHSNLSLAALPSLDWNAYAQSLGRLPVYFSWDASGAALDRSEPGFSTGVLPRLDFSPHLTVPVTTDVGTFTGDLSMRTTFYSEHQQIQGNAAANPAPTLLAGDTWRDAYDADLEWRPPALARIYQDPGGWLGPRVEHVFEPEVGFHAVGGVDDANQIIRFDSTDILSNTRELEYGFTNRLLAAGAQPGSSRELVSWTLLQKRYFEPSFGGALQPGERNVFLTNVLFSPFALEAEPQKFSPLSSVVRVSPFTRFDGEWRLDYAPTGHQVAASAFSGNFHFGKGFFSGSHYLLRSPAGLSPLEASPRFDQVRLAAGIGNASAPGYSFASAVAYDAVTGKLQYTTVQASHNWDCCGFSAEYRRFSLATVRRENQFLISFTLANVATFGNLKRQDRLF
ncbi:MAG TPA: LPS assembly protein LptD [Terriglobales bacterium]|nr:LPS assembly protein LptD [Terriglobales bacterium]